MNNYGISEAKSSVGFKAHAVPNRALGEAKSLRGWLLRGAIFVSAFSMVFSAFVPTAGATNDKVEICHSTGSQSNPYVQNEPSKSGDLNGHSGHTGPVWYPGINESWGDIIPPFTYWTFQNWQLVQKNYPGQNWTTEGQAIWNADCEFGTLTLVKKVEGGSAANTDWDLNADGPFDISGETGSSDVTNRVVLKGKYTLSESGGPSNYQASSWTCKDGNQSVSVNGSSQVEIKKNKNIVCTITNTYTGPTTGTLTLVKIVSQNAIDPISAWTLNANGSGDLNDFSGQSGVSKDVDPGNFDLSETGPTQNYSASDWSCILDTDSVDVPAQMVDGDTVTISAGQNVVCTILNTYTPDPDVPLLHFIKVVCDEYEDVYGNKDADKEDDTGGKYSLFKNSPAFGGIVKPVSPDEIPKDAGCERADGWKFKLATDLPQTQNVSEVGPTNLGEFVTPISGDGSALTLEQQNAIRNGQLWISEVEKPGYGFAAIRCYNDALNGDNLEFVNIGNNFQGTDIYCIAYNVSLRPQEPPCKEGPAWAATVVASEQGKRKDGSDVIPERSDANKALGAADWVTGTGTNFYSLGFGGTITVSFAGYVNNVVGDDLSIHEATNGTYPNETVKIEVSQTGLDGSWYTLSEAGSNTNPLGVTYVDFNETGLSWIKFVKLTDTSNPALFEATADGFDLDAVDATQQLCEPPVQEEECEQFDIFDRVVSLVAVDTKKVQCSISGHKYRDSNTNGQIDSGTDELLQGWDIFLDTSSACSYNGDEPIRTTDANGDYEFNNLAAGTYYVCERQKPYWDQVLPNNGVGPGQWVHEITLINTSVSDVDFLNVETHKDACEAPKEEESFISNFIGILSDAVIDDPNPYCAISGHKYEDENLNDEIDKNNEGYNDPTVEGVTIFLTINETCNYGDAVAETTTDVNGYYEFTNLASDTYYVCELLSEGWTQVLPAIPGYHAIELSYFSHENVDFLNRNDNPEPCEEPIAVTLASSTSTQFKGSTTELPSNLADESEYTDGTDGNTFVVSHPAWATIGGTEWVSFSSTTPPAGGDVWYLYSHEFTIPTGATGITAATLEYSADNRVTVFLDNVQIDQSLSDTTFSGIKSIALPTLTPGTHTLEFAVQNIAFQSDNPTGVTYKTEFQYTPDCNPPGGGDDDTTTVSRSGSGRNNDDNGRVLGDSTGLPYQAPQVLGEATELPRTGTPLAIAFSVIGILAIIMIPRYAKVVVKK